jgi:hypothetical protein
MEAGIPAAAKGSRAMTVWKTGSGGKGFEMQETFNYRYLFGRGNPDGHFSVYGKKKGGIKILPVFKVQYSMKKPIRN